jgi:signal transduction histidine kinase
VVECERGSVAVVDLDANLADQEELIRATAKTGVIWLEKERLASELAASKSSLEASRVRLARTADEERRRIQRDLHDGAQQHLIGMHLKLELALEALAQDPSRSVALLAEVGDEMGETASDLRALASHVFPPTLSEHGLVDALASAIRRMGLAVSLEARGIGRHPGEVETQVYFVCVEGLQNIGKHGGPAVAATLRLWEVPRWLYVELRDWGTGFDPDSVDGGGGLQNMHDRLESIGGQLRVRSHPGQGTLIRGVVPLRRARRPGRAPAW